jgi:uncharacterized membrane protein
MRTDGQRGTLATVLAEPALSSAGYRRRWAVEWVRERFWVIPAAQLVLGPAPALAAATAAGTGFWGSRGGLPADAAWASGFLENLAAATLTFLGVVFTLTLVASQLASAQLSPPAGGVFAAAHPAPGQVPGAVPDREIAAALNSGRGRTLYQDPAFGLRQLADTAAQALSPAVNQPTTAVLVIDSLEDILLLIARCPRQSGCFTSRDQAVRLMTPLPDWDDCLDRASAEITAYGAGSPQAARRQLATDGTIQQALRPDPMGLG